MALSNLEKCFSTLSIIVTQLPSPHVQGDNMAYLACGVFGFSKVDHRTNIKVDYPVFMTAFGIESDLLDKRCHKSSELLLCDLFTSVHNFRFPISLNLNIN